MSWNSNKKYSERERWICVYPVYINSKKTLAEGRRIIKNKCVENPTYQEIKDVLIAAGLNVEVENKMFPRDPNRDPMCRGRVRVHIKHDDGQPVNPNFPNKESVLLYCCETIPKLKIRQQKQNGPDQQTQATAKKSKGKKGKR